MTKLVVRFVRSFCVQSCHAYMCSVPALRGCFVDKQTKLITTIARCLCAFSVAFLPQHSASRVLTSVVQLLGVQPRVLLFVVPDRGESCWDIHAQRVSPLLQGLASTRAPCEGWCVLWPMRLREDFLTDQCSGHCSESRDDREVLCGD